MSISRDKARGLFVFEFDRVIQGQRVRARKRLPRAWNQAQADSFDRAETARLYAIAQGIGGEHHLIDDAVACYLRERVPALKHGPNTARELAATAWAWHGRPLSALPDVCKAIAVKWRDTLTPATIRNRIRYLSAACRYGWKHHRMGDTDPGARVVVPTVRNERQLYIDRRQMLMIAKACTNRKARMAIRIAFYSGMRLGEILRAVLIDGRWHLADTKNDEPRLVPIHPRVAVCARRFVAGPKITVQQCFRKAANSVGMTTLHFHDIRHSCASELINSGVDIFTVGAVLGHRDQRSTARYSHLQTQTLADAIGKIGQKSSTTLLRRVA